MEDTSKRFKALANKNRLAIFEYLRSHGAVCGCGPDECCSVGNIAEQFDLALSTISHHLKVLFEAGLIVCEQRGQFSYCSIDNQTVEELRDFLSTAP